MKRTERNLKLLLRNEDAKLICRICKRVRVCGEASRKTVFTSGQKPHYVLSHTST